MTDPASDTLANVRVLAEARNLDDLHAACRLRSDQLHLSRSSLDRLAGLCDGQASKLLAPLPIKQFSLNTLQYVLGALSLKLLVVPDDEMFARLQSRYVAREERAVRHASAGDARGKRRGHSWVSKGNRAWGVMMNHRRNAVLDPTVRSALARRAAKARWDGEAQSEAAP